MVGTQVSTPPIMRPRPGRIMAQAHITHLQGRIIRHVIVHLNRIMHHHVRIIHLGIIRLSRITSIVTHHLTTIPIIVQALRLSLDTASYVVLDGQLDQTWVTAFGTKPLGSVVTVM